MHLSLPAVGLLKFPEDLDFHKINAFLWLCAPAPALVTVATFASEVELQFVLLTAEI